MNVSLKKRKIFIICAIAILLFLHIVQIIMATSKGAKILLLDDEIDLIEITNNENIFVLEKKDDTWFFENNDMTNNLNKINLIIENIKNITIVDTVSKNTNGENLVRYGFDFPIKIIAKKDEKNLRQILVGKTSTTNFQTFIILNGEKKIYLASKNLVNVFSVTKDDFKSNTKENSNTELAQ